jgi:catechol 2,3-dioxygenase-like lactoylglutathione lyase family enzyme
MDWKLEVVMVPVTDPDRAKSFYVEKAGFNPDIDRQLNPQTRIIQLTPPGSACSIMLRIGPDQPAVHGLQLVVPDIEAARAELADRGVQVSEVQRLAPGDGGAFVFFSDPDGNGWAVQEIRGRG